MIIYLCLQETFILKAYWLYLSFKSVITVYFYSNGRKSIVHKIIFVSHGAIKLPIFQQYYSLALKNPYKSVVKKESRNVAFQNTNRSRARIKEVRNNGGKKQDEIKEAWGETNVKEREEKNSQSGVNPERQRSPRQQQNEIVGEKFCTCVGRSPPARSPGCGRESNPLEDGSEPEIKILKRRPWSSDATSKLEPFFFPFYRGVWPAGAITPSRVFLHQII